MKIKIYECGPDYIMATSKEEAQKFLMSHAGIDEEDVPLEDWNELNDEAMEDHYVINSDVPYNEEKDEPNRLSFKEYRAQLVKQGAKFPLFFCSSEW